jgi:hypothetical protein
MPVSAGAPEEETRLWVACDSEAETTPDVDCCRLDVTLGKGSEKLGCVPMNVDV